MATNWFLKSGFILLSYMYCRFFMCPFLQFFWHGFYLFPIEHRVQLIFILSTPAVLDTRRGICVCVLQSCALYASFCFGSLFPVFLRQCKPVASVTEIRRYALRSNRTIFTKSRSKVRVILSFFFLIFNPTPYHDVIRNIICMHCLLHLPSIL